MPPADPVFAFPLPVQWRTEIPWFGWVRDAPVVEADQVIARCGQTVAGFERHTGTILWRAQLDILPGDGEFFGSVRQVYVTEGRRVRDKMSSLFAVTQDGDVQWRLDLPTILPRGHIRVHGDDLLAVGIIPNQDAHLWIIDVRFGRVRSQVSLPEGGSMAVIVGDQLVIGRRLPGQSEPGLYLASREGKCIEPLLSKPVANLLHESDTLVVVARDEATSEYTIEVRDAATLGVRWAAKAITEAVAMDGGEVVYAEGSGEHSSLVLRDGRTGKLCWQGAPLSRSPGTVALADGAVLAKHLGSMSIHRRSDGVWLGQAVGDFGYAASARDNRLFLGEKQAVLCASLEGLDQ